MKGHAMHTEPEILSSIPDDPETHARDAIEAMRATGTDRPNVERAILAAGRGHARVLEEIAGEWEPPR